MQSFTPGDGVLFTALAPGPVGNNILVAYSAPSGSVTTVSFAGTITVSPMSGETNAGVVAAIQASAAASALVIAAVWDLVVEFPPPGQAANLTLGVGFPNVDLLLTQGAYGLTANLTVPSGITLRFEGGAIGVAAGSTLTINGPVVASSMQIFSGAGVVTFGLPSAGTQSCQDLNVKWWGAVGDGLTDDWAPVQAALNAAWNVVGQFVPVEVNGIPTATVGVTVYLPPGNYACGTTLEMNYSTWLRGDEAVLTPIIANIKTQTILRTAGPSCRISGIQFVGGLNAIAMFGQVFHVGTGYFGPTVSVNPLQIWDCSFLLQYGPSIWQDCSPATTVAPSSSGQMLGGAFTLNVACTAQFSGTTRVQIDFGGGNAQILTLSSLGVLSPTELAISGGGSGTLSAGQVVTSPDNNRTFQTMLLVDDFIFHGPHLYWGSGDTVVFKRGMIKMDCWSLYDGTFPGYQADSNGFPLALVNSADYVSFESCAFDPPGPQVPIPTFAPPYWIPYRMALFVGGGLLIIRSCHITDLPGYPTARLQAYSNGYANGPNGVPISFNAIAPTNLGIVEDDFQQINAGNAYWLECLDFLPFEIRLDTAVDTYGVWISSTLNLQALICQQPIQPATFTARDQATASACFVFRQGTDPGSGSNPSETAGSDVTAVFTGSCVQHNSYARADIAILEEQNLVLAGVIDTHSPGVTQAPDLPSTLDNTTGYALTQYTTNGDAVGCNLPLIPAQDTFPGGLPAGVYCFSCYLKTSGGGSAYIDTQWTPATTTVSVAGMAITVFPRAWETNAGVVAAIQASAAASLVSATVVGSPTDLVLRPGSEPLAGGTASTQAALTVPSATSPEGVQFTALAAGLAGNSISVGYSFIPPGTSVTLGTERVEASDSYQRISIPFYFPGGAGVCVQLSIAVWDLQPGNTCAIGLFQVNRGPVPTEYMCPGNDAALTLGLLPQRHFAPPSAPAEGTSPPPGLASGTWKVGDLVWNTKPAAGGWVGWVCVTAGPPAVWKAFGAIST